MCGIFGFAGRPRAGMEKTFRAFMNELALATEHRGPHATGVAGYISPARSIVAKGDVRARQFIKTPAWDKAMASRSMIGHCRYATHGSPKDNRNNHPFESGKWAMVHNGVIYGHEAIAHQYGLKLKSECDSEIILRLFAQGAKDGAGPVAGLQHFADAIQNRPADYAVALIDRKTGTVRLLRDDGRPCAIVKLPSLGIVAFASTPEILKRAMEEARKVEADALDGAEGWPCSKGKVYVLKPGTLEVTHETVTIKAPLELPNYVGRITEADTTEREPGADEECPGCGMPTKSCECEDVADALGLCPLCGKAECSCEELTAP